MFINDRDAIEFGNRIQESPEERILYSYVQGIARHMPHKQAIDDFYRLLFDGNSYPEQDVSQALYQILDSPEFAQTGKFVFNRLFHIMGNGSVYDPNKQEALHEVITRIARQLPSLNIKNRNVRKLRQLAHDYVESDLYLALQWQMRLLRDEEQEADAPEVGKLLKTKFKELFFLQEALATTCDIPPNRRKGIRRAQATQAGSLEERLLTFANNSSQADTEWLDSLSLSCEEVRLSVETYRPQSQKGTSIGQEAHEFYQEVQNRNLGYLRKRLFLFLLQPLAEASQKYTPDARGYFQFELKQCLAKGLGDDLSFNHMAVTKIGKNLLDFLVVKSLRQHSSPHFQRLLRHVGHMAVTKMLLRLVLFFPKLRFWLSERFAILFHVHKNKYKSDQKIAWLVRALDHLNIGLALNRKQLGYFEFP